MRKSVRPRRSERFRTRLSSGRTACSRSWRLCSIRRLNCRRLARGRNACASNRHGHSERGRLQEDACAHGLQFEERHRRARVGTERNFVIRIEEDMTRQIPQRQPSSNAWPVFVVTAIAVAAIGWWLWSINTPSRSASTAPNSQASSSVSAAPSVTPVPPSKQAANPSSSETTGKADKEPSTSTATGQASGGTSSTRPDTAIPVQRSNIRSGDLNARANHVATDAGATVGASRGGVGLSGSPLPEPAAGGNVSAADQNRLAPGAAGSGASGALSR